MSYYLGTMSHGRQIERVPVELRFSKTGISISHPVEFKAQEFPYYLSSIRWYNDLEVWHETEMGIDVESEQDIRIATGGIRIDFNKKSDKNTLSIKRNGEGWDAWVVVR